ncbi:MAG: glycosyl hydrolase family 8 [Oscillospiraceae bacterium]|nr:glycosyl hydrolase family 8 [Oscillospiraceae bacterium]
MKHLHFKSILSKFLTLCLTISFLPLNIFKFDVSAAADPDLITVIDFEDYNIGPWTGFATRGANYPDVFITADPDSPGQKSLQVNVKDWNQAPIIPIHLPYALSDYKSISVRLRAVSGNVGDNGLQIFASGSNAEAGNFIRYGFGNESGAANQFVNRRIAAFSPTVLSTTSWTTVEVGSLTLTPATQDLQGDIFLAIGINTNAVASYLIDDIIFTLKDGVLPANSGAAVNNPVSAAPSQKSIIVDPVTIPSNPGGQAVEYGIRTINSPPSVWQDGLTFGNLNPNTDYYIFARSKANATHRAGAPSASLHVKTTALSAPVPASAGQGAAETGIYRNMFLEAGYSQEEIDARVKRTYDRLFNGADGGGYNIYVPVGTDMAYIHAVDSNDVRSEGMSYGMMMALQMDDQEKFDRLWNWAHTYMLNKSGEARGYFAWQCGINGNKMDTNPAPDGEMYFATALLFASNRWGDKTGIYEYGREARIILYDLINRRAGERKPLFNLDNKLPEFSPMTSFTDASYHLSAFFEIWAEEIIYGEQYWDIWNNDIGAVTRDATFYRESAAVCRDWLMTKGTHPVTGLSSEYAQYDGTPGGGGGVGNSHLFSYDSWRTAMNIALDHSWWAKDARQIAHADRIQTFFIHPDRNPNGIFSYGNKWYVDGSPVQNDGHSAGLVAGNAAASLAASDAQAWDFIDHFWNIGQDQGLYRYYGGCLYMFAMLKLSGNYKAYYSTGPGTGAVKNSRIAASDTVFDKAAPAEIPVNVVWNGNTLTGITGNGALLAFGTDYTTASNVITLSSTYLTAQATYSTVRLEFTFSAGEKRTLSIYIDDTSKSILGHTFEERVSVQYTPGPQSGSQTLTANYRGDDLLHVVKTGGHSSHAVIFPFRLADGALNTYNTLYVRLRLVSGFSGGRNIRVEAGSAGTKFSQLGNNTQIGGLSQNLSDSTSFIDLQIPLSGQPAISGDINIAFGLMNAADHAYELEYIGLVPRGTVTVPSSNIDKTTANFDKANPAAIPIIMTLNGNTLTGINRGGTALLPDTDYTVSGNNVSINASYLNTLPIGTTNLTFTFSAGASRTLAVTVAASNASISPASETFDKSGSSDITVNITPNGNNTLTAVRNGAVLLTPDADYSVSGNEVTLNNAYLKTLAFGTAVTLTFEFSPGANQTFTVNVEDSSIQNAVLGSYSATFDKFSPEDIDVDMTLNGNTLQGINHGAVTLSEDNQFTRSSDTVKLLESYLLTLSIGVNTLTFEFEPGINRTFTVTVSDSTPVVGTPARLSYDFSKDNITDLIEFNTNKNADTIAEIKSGVLEVTAAATGDLVVIPFDLGPLTLNDIQSVRIRVRSTTGDTNYKTFGVAASATGIYSTGMAGFTPIASQSNGFSTANNWGTFTMPVTPGVAASLNGIVKLGFGVVGSHTPVTYQISEIELIPKPGAIPNATLTPSGAAFDTENPDDITINIAWNGNALGAVKNGTVTLTPNVHYIIIGNLITIRESYLANLPNGKTTLTFEFSPGHNRTFDINVAAGGGGDFILPQKMSYDFSTDSVTPMYNVGANASTKAEIAGGALQVTLGARHDIVVIPFDIGSFTMDDIESITVEIAAISGDSTHKNVRMVTSNASANGTFGLLQTNNALFTRSGALGGANGWSTWTNNITPGTASDYTQVVHIGIGINDNHNAPAVFHIRKIALNLKPSSVIPCAHILSWTFNATHHWQTCSKCPVKENENTHTLVYESGGNMHWQVCSNTNCDYKTAADDCAAAPPSVPYASFGTPTLGTNNTIWNNAAELDVSNSNHVNATARGKARVLWDDSFLYVRVEVTDPDVYTGTPPNNHHNYDGVEIFVGAGSSGSNQYRLNPSGARSGQAPNESWAGITGTGYIVEFKVAKGSLTFAPDAPLTFEVQINDSSSAGGTRLGCISWYAAPDTAWGGSSAFANSLLLWKPSVITSDVWQTDSFEHWKVCAACGNKFNRENHISNNAQENDCFTANECTVCDDEITPAKSGHSYGSWGADDSNCKRTCTNGNCSDFETHVTASDNANNTNCTANSICMTCSRIVVSAGSHSLSAGWFNDDTNHWKKCENNSCAHTADLTAHVSDNAQADDCLVPNKCLDCGYEMTAAKENHNYVQQYNASQHWEKCSDCPAERNRANHTWTNGTGADDTYHICACGATEEHSYGGYTSEVDATCLSKGSRTRTCQTAGCARIETSPHPDFAPHNYSTSFTVDIAPECLVDGEESHHCQTPGCTERNGIRAIQAIGHDMITDYVVPATCTDYEVTHRKCDRPGCLHTEQSNTAVPDGHNWGTGWYESSDQTSVPEGKVRLERKCTPCGDIEYDIVNICPGVTHDFSIEGEVTKSATCAVDGEQTFYCVHSDLGCTEHVTKPISHTTVSHTNNGAQALNCLAANECSVCFIELLTAKDSHNSNNAQAGNCTMPNTCLDCGIEILAAGSHDYQWTATTDATCSQEGIETEKCTVCEDIKGTKPISKLPHTFNADSQKTETHHKCIDCSHTEPHSFNPETGICTVCSYFECPAHEWDENDENDCICTICGLEQTHDWGAGWTPEAGKYCGDIGNEIRICANCSRLENKSETLIEHNFISYSPLTSATCTMTATEQSICKYNGDNGCTETHIRSVGLPLGHDFGTSKNNGTHECNRDDCEETETCSPNTAGATCEACGYKTPSGECEHSWTLAGSTPTHCACENCEDTKLHNWGGWIVTTQPTSSREGSRNRTCSDCERNVVESIPKTTGGGGGGGGGGGTSSGDDTSPVQPAANIVQIGNTGVIPANFVIPAATVNNIAGTLPFARLRIFSAGNQIISFGIENAGKNAVLIKYNSETGELEFVSSVVIGTDGNARKNIPATGDYLVIVRKIGDITATGEVTTTDALALLRHIAGIARLNALELFVANGKAGDTGTTDALNILRYIAGVIDKI